VIPVGLIIKLVLGFILISVVGSFIIYIKYIINRNKRLKTENKQITIRAEIAEKDSKALLKYMQAKKELIEINKKEVADYEKAIDKHDFINNLISKL